MKNNSAPRLLIIILLMLISQKIFSQTELKNDDTLIFVSITLLETNLVNKRGGFAITFGIDGQRKLFDAEWTEVLLVSDAKDTIPILYNYPFIRIKKSNLTSDLMTIEKTCKKYFLFLPYRIEKKDKIQPCYIKIAWVGVMGSKMFLNLTCKKLKVNSYCKYIYSSDNLVVTGIEKISKAP